MNKGQLTAALITKICTERKVPELRYETAFFEENERLVKKILERKADLPSIEFLQKTFKFEPVETEMTMADIQESLDVLYFKESCRNVIKEFAEEIKQNGEPTDRLDKLMKRFNNIRGVLTPNYVCEVSTDRSKVADEYESQMGDANFVKSGFDIFDNIVAPKLGDLIMVCGPTKRGKCLGKDTPVLMFDGTIKMVQDIKQGELLMGPDSTPRTVLSTVTGRSKMYKIIPNKGDFWTCNDAHILSLKRTDNKEIVDISVEDYLTKSKTFKHLHKQFRVGVEFNSQHTNMHPYLIGLWLGDGSVGASRIHNPDGEVLTAIKEIAPSYGLVVNIGHYNDKCPQINISYPEWQQNPFLDEIRKCYINDEKRIPQNYLINGRENRLQLLAGIIDTDGFYSDKKYEVITKFDGLKDDILYLARSLGYAAYASKKIGKIKETGFEAEYWRINLSGDFSDLPIRIERKKPKLRTSKKDVLVTGFKVEELPEDDYYGFLIDRDHRFVLGDFTVTHNTATMLQMQKNAIINGDASIYFSLEMDVVEVNNRILSGFQKHKFNDLKFHKVSKEQYKSSMDEIFGEYPTPTHIVTRQNESAINLGTIEKYIQDYKPRVVFVDYLTLLDDVGYDWNADSPTKQLKRMAQQYRCVIYVGTQAVSEFTDLNNDEVPGPEDVFGNKTWVRDVNHFLGVTSIRRQNDENSKDDMIKIVMKYKVGISRDSKLPEFTYYVTPETGKWEDVSQEYAMGIM